MTANRSMVVAEALSWLGTPYHHEGRIKGSGTDCAMFLVEVFHRCRLIPAIDPRPYPMDWAAHSGEERYLNWLTRFGKPCTNLAAGDVLVWKFFRTYSHGAIMISARSFVHALRDQGVILGQLDEGMLSGRPYKSYTLFPTV